MYIHTCLYLCNSICMNRHRHADSLPGGEIFFLPTWDGEQVDILECI